MLKLINAGIEDRTLIYNIKRESIKSYVETVWGWDETYQKNTFEKDFREIRHQLIVLDDIAGYVAMKETEKGIHLNEIHLIVSFQGRGIGSTLLEELKRKHHHITLGCFKQNIRAKAFYLKQNFEIVGESETHYMLEYIEPHERVYRKLQTAGHGGWGGNNYENRMLGWDEHIEIILNKTGLKKGSVLEMGSGAGDVCIKLHDLGFTCTGVEISDTAVNWSVEKAGERAIEFYCDSVCNQTLLMNQHFDLVLDANCLHCLFDEDRELFYRNAQRLLKKEGYFIVSSVILKEVNDETPTVSPIGRCVLSETAIVEEVRNHFELETYYVTEHSNHNHFWGFCKLKNKELS